MSNTWGAALRLTTFGESHGPALGAVLDGLPAGLPLDLEAIQQALLRRRPGQSRLTTQRRETEELEVLSGLFEGNTLGTPLALVVRNTDARPRDYSHLQDSYRPSHADYTWEAKFGHRDYRGGGRSSARETLARVLGGEVARQVLLARYPDVQVLAWVQQVGELQAPADLPQNQLTRQAVDAHPVRCPDPATAAAMEQLIVQTRKAGDTLGGVVRGLIVGLPPGWGEPVFGKLHSELGRALLSINAVKGFSYGSGFGGVHLRGSEHNDPFYTDASGAIGTRSNHSGGVQGGISNGMPVNFDLAFKPVATLLRNQESVNRSGEPITVEGRGRHDPCVLPRAVPIVEAMCWLVLCDLALQHHMRANWLSA